MIDLKVVAGSSLVPNREIFNAKSAKSLVTSTEILINVKGKMVRKMVKILWFYQEMIEMSSQSPKV